MCHIVTLLLAWDRGQPPCPNLIHLSITTQGLLLSLVSFLIIPFFRRKANSLSTVRFEIPSTFAIFVAVVSPSTLKKATISFCLSVS